MIYDYSITTGKGDVLNLADYKGKVILVVNTATGCGFTPQYAPIEQLYRDYHDQGLEILDIPCNQFGGQAPGSDEEIHPDAILVEDYRAGDMICPECGLVVGKQLL